MDSINYVISGGRFVAFYSAARDNQKIVQANVVPDVFDTREAALDAAKELTRNPCTWPIRVGAEVYTGQILNRKSTL